MIDDIEKPVGQQRIVDLRHQQSTVLRTLELG